MRTAAKQFSWATAVCLFRSAHKAAMGQADRRVLVLGAGYVAHPAIEYLSRDAQTHVTIGTYCCTCHETHRHLSLSVCPDTQTYVTIGTYCCTCRETHRHMSLRTSRHADICHHWYILLYLSWDTDTCHHQYILLYQSWDTQTHVTIGTYCCTCHETHRHMSPSVRTAVPVMRHTDTCHHRYVLLYQSWDIQTHVTISTYCCTCHETQTHVTIGTYCCTCRETHRHVSLSVRPDTQTHGTVHTSCCTYHKTHWHVALSVCPAVHVVRLTHGAVRTSCCTCHKIQRHLSLLVPPVSQDTLTHSTVGMSCCTCRKTHWHMALSVHPAVLIADDVSSILCVSSPFFSKVVVCTHRLVTLSLTVSETWKWLLLLPISMQKSFWWWPCSISCNSPHSTSWDLGPHQYLSGDSQHWMSLAKCLHSWTLTTMLSSILTLRLDWKPVVLTLSLTRLQLPGTSSLFLSVVQPLSVFFKPLLNFFLFSQTFSKVAFSWNVCVFALYRYVPVKRL